MRNSSRSNSKKSSNNLNNSLNNGVAGGGVAGAGASHSQQQQEIRPTITLPPIEHKLKDAQNSDSHQNKEESSNGNAFNTIFNRRNSSHSRHKSSGGGAGMKSQDNFNDEERDEQTPLQKEEILSNPALTTQNKQLETMQQFSERVNEKMYGAYHNNNSNNDGVEERKKMVQNAKQEAMSLSPQLLEKRVIDRKDIPLYDDEDGEGADEQGGEEIQYVQKDKNKNKNHQLKQNISMSKASSMNGNGPTSTDEKSETEKKIEVNNFNPIVLKNSHNLHFS